MKNLQSLLVAVLILFFSSVAAIPDTTHIWYHDDPATTGNMGISLREAYQFAKDKNLNAKEVVVAVIDSGIDTSHVDLTDNLWVNQGEIPHNGIDDDRNGYVDDVHGWNFLGNDDGYCVEGETLEQTRIYRDYKKRFAGKSKKDIAKDERHDFKEWLEIRKAFEKEYQNAQNALKNITLGLKAYDNSVVAIQKHLKKDEFTREDVENIKSDDERLQAAVGFYLFPFGSEMSREDIVSAKEYYEEKVNKRLNVNYNPRTPVGDDVMNINDSLYGNPVLYPEGSNHGTGVSGIIGAIRGNGIGLDGIAPKVKIMMIRVVPGGDEYDKDVALAIRYAVKMGARIINCSFGKDYSPDKNLVDEAVRYAAENDVLIVHASGNDGRNIDKGNNFPTKYLDNPAATAPNWIEVGASDKKVGLGLAADFSNYGKEVDIFAPGVDIFSTNVKSKFGFSDGTSDAAPVVSGVAALLLAYYPELSAIELKSYILQSGTDKGDVVVYLPNDYGKKKKTKFGKLSASGKIVNAYSALKLVYENQQALRE
ncbi:MAG: S8 family serine peptidase [Bacteroidales bacterium]|nr:S8 family serine peptidase [Bacteroidales bacterium]